MTLRSEPVALVSMILLLVAATAERVLPALPPMARHAGLVASLVVGGYSLALWRREQAADPSTRALSRRYLRESLWPMLSYVLVLFLSVWLLKHIEATWLRALVALTPVLPIVLALRATARYIRDLDELQRRIELEALALGSVGIGFAYLTAAFLHGARVIQVPAGSAMFWVFPLLCMGYGIAKCIVARRYR